VLGNLLVNSVDEFARTTEARERGFRAAEPVHVLAKHRVKAKHVAQVFLEVALQAQPSPPQTRKQAALDRGPRTDRLRYTMLS